MHVICLLCEPRARSLVFLLSQQTMAEVVDLAARAIATPFLLWRGWESNKTEEQKLADFLAHAKQSLCLANNLPPNELENLFMDLACIDEKLKTTLGEMSNLTRLTAPEKVASEIAGLKSQAEEFMKRFRDRISIDTHNISFELRRYRKVSECELQCHFHGLCRSCEAVL